MKIVQIENGFVHWDASNEVPSLEYASEHYASDICFIEAPNYVFEGWAFDGELEGDDRFIKPVAPEGWWYDEMDGTFKPDGYEEPKTADEKIEELRMKMNKQIDFMQVSTTILSEISQI